MCASYGVRVVAGKDRDDLGAKRRTGAAARTTAGIAANALGVPSSRITVRNGSTLDPSVTPRSARLHHADALAHREQRAHVPRGEEERFRFFHG